MEVVDLTMTSSQLSLKQRVLNAGMWSLVGYIFSFAIRFGGNLFMTRQLLPEMFGVMAIASMVLVGLGMFSDVGLKPSVVQSKRGDEPAFLNTAWVIQILRGILLWCFAISVSLLIPLAGRLDLIPGGSVYDDPNLPYVIAALSFTTIIAGLESTKLLQASRNLLLAQITRIEITVQIFGLLVMVAWVLVDRSILALVAGTISSALLRTLLSHIWLPGAANQWQWDREAFGEIIRFGKWIFLSTVMYFVVSNGDRMVLGALIDASSLGTYAIAFLIFSSVDQVLTKIIVDVSFPALSEMVRYRSAKLTESYYRFHAVIATFTYFCCGILMVSGQSIIGLLYDERYQQAGWILEILAVALLTLPFRVATQCFLAFGLSRVYFHLHTIRMIALFIALPLGFHLWGLQGATWGVVFSYFSSLPLTLFYAASLGLFDLRKELVALSVLIIGVISGAALNATITFITHLGIRS
jgi:O-antigen/teichoic acid export membrane protein